MYPQQVPIADTMLIWTALATLATALIACLAARMMGSSRVSIKLPADNPWNSRDTVLVDDSGSDSPAKPSAGSLNYISLLLPLGAWLVSAPLLAFPHWSRGVKGEFYFYALPFFIIMTLSLREFWAELIKFAGITRPAASDSWNSGLSKPVTPVALWSGFYLFLLIAPHWWILITHEWKTRITHSLEENIASHIFLMILFVFPLIPMFLEKLGSKRGLSTRIWSLARLACTAAGACFLALFTFQGLIQHCFHYDILGFPIYKYPLLRDWAGDLLQIYAISCRSSLVHGMVWLFWIMTGIHHGRELIDGAASLKKALENLLRGAVEILVTVFGNLARGLLIILRRIPELIISGISQFFLAIYRGVTGLCRGVITIISSTLEFMVSLARDTYELALAVTLGLLNGAVKLVKGLAGSITSLCKAMTEAIIGIFGQISERGVLGIIGAIYFWAVNRLFDLFTRMLGTDKGISEGPSVLGKTSAP